MPKPEGHRPPTQHKKVQQIEDQDGWTHVIRGPRLPSTELSGRRNRDDGSKHLRQNLVKEQLSIGYMSLDEIQSKYMRARKIWAEEPARSKFEDIFSTRITGNADCAVNIDNIIVLGLGSVAADNMDSSSMHQLVLLEHWITFLRTRFTINAVYFQDPAFVDNDKTFLGELGYQVIVDHEAYLLLSETTFLFAPYVPWEIIYTFYYAAYPCLLVSNGTHTNANAFQQDRSEMLDHIVVRSFYDSRDCAHLGVDQGKGEDKHLFWLRDMVLYWPRDPARADAPGNREAEYSSREEGQYSTQAILDRAETQAPLCNPSKGSVPGIWHPVNGFVFDSDFGKRLDAIREQRSQVNK